VRNPLSIPCGSTVSFATGRAGSNSETRPLYQRALFRSTIADCIALASFTHAHPPTRPGGIPLRLCSGIAHDELEERRAKYEERRAKCEVRSAKCEVRSAKCEVRSAKCEERSTKREERRAKYEERRAKSEERSTKSEVRRTTNQAKNALRCIARTPRRNESASSCHKTMRSTLPVAAQPPRNHRAY
jgi:flagellar biosynthesis GTPase FlhF